MLEGREAEHDFTQIGNEIQKQAIKVPNFREMGK